MSLDKKLFLNMSFLLLSVFISQAQQLKIPFKLEGGFVVIKLPMENSADSLTYIFDTGAGGTVLDKNVASKYHLKASGKIEAMGSAGQQSYGMLAGQKIFLGKDLYMKGVTLVLGDLRALNSIGSTSKFDGIIGYDILKNYITMIDFIHKEIVLYNFNDNIDKSAYSEISFTKNSSIPKFPITIELSNGEKYTKDILFDSGAGQVSLLISSLFVNENKLKEKLETVGKIVGQGLGAAGSMSYAVITSIKIAKFTFNNVPVQLSDAGTGVSSSKDILGILGQSLINRFDIIIDYSKSKIYLKPNNLFDNEFRLVNSFDLSESDSSVVVRKIIKESEAYDRGLRVGFKILTVNNDPVHKKEEYYKLLRSNGWKAKIEYLDDKKMVHQMDFEEGKIANKK